MKPEFCKTPLIYNVYAFYTGNYIGINVLPFETLHTMTRRARGPVWVGLNVNVDKFCTFCLVEKFYEISSICLFYHFAKYEILHYIILFNLKYLA